MSMTRTVGILPQIIGIDTCSNDVKIPYKIGRRSIKKPTRTC